MGPEFTFTIVDHRQESVVVKAARAEDDATTGRLKFYDAEGELVASFIGYQSFVKNVD